MHPTRYTESGLLARLLGTAAQGRGIGPLHTLPMLTKSSGIVSGAGAPLAGPTRRAEPMLEPLFRDLSWVLEKVTRPVAQELRLHATHSGRALVALRLGIIFFVYAAALVRRLAAAGLPLCRPAIAPADERVCEVTDLSNLQLALHLSVQEPGDLTKRVGTSDSIIGPQGRIAILTGPNQGGKTTYIQAVGQAQVLAQAGLHVPGRQARISQHAADDQGLSAQTPSATTPFCTMSRSGRSHQRCLNYLRTWLFLCDCLSVQIKYTTFRTYCNAIDALRIADPCGLVLCSGANSHCCVRQRMLRVRDTMEIEGPGGECLAMVRKAMITPIRDRWTVKVDARRLLLGVPYHTCS